MVELTFTVNVDEDRRLVIDLPDEMPIGKVEVTVRPMEQPDEASEPLTRERARAILKAAGMLSELTFPEARTEPLPEEEAQRLAQLFSGERPSHELIDEDRDER